MRPISSLDTTLDDRHRDSGARQTAAAPRTAVASMRYLPQSVNSTRRTLNPVRRTSDVPLSAHKRTNYPPPRTKNVRAIILCDDDDDGHPNTLLAAAATLRLRVYAGGPTATTRPSRPTPCVCIYRRVLSSLDYAAAAVILPLTALPGTAESPELESRCRRPPAFDIRIYIRTVAAAAAAAARPNTPQTHKMQPPHVCVLLCSLTRGLLLFIPVSVSRIR